MLVLGSVSSAKRPGHCFYKKMGYETKSQTLVTHDGSMGMVYVPIQTWIFDGTPPVHEQMVGWKIPICCW